MHRLLLLITLLLFNIASEAGNLGNQFVTTKLAYGASIDIPRSWQIRRGNEMRAIETAVGAAIDLAGYSTLIGGSESLLVSSFPDGRLYAGVTVTTTELPGSSRSSATSLTDAQLKSGGQTIRQGMEATLARLGGKAWGWTPLKTISMGKATALHISYFRSSDAGNRRVHIYKFFGTGRIYDVALSTSVAAEDVNGVVLKKIADSFSAL
jgi:hypothetical protein